MFGTMLSVEGLGGRCNEDWEGHSIQSNKTIEAWAKGLGGTLHTTQIPLFKLFHCISKSTKVIST